MSTRVNFSNQVSVHTYDQTEVNNPDWTQAAADRERFKDRVQKFEGKFVSVLWNNKIELYKGYLRDETIVWINKRNSKGNVNVSGRLCCIKQVPSLISQLYKIYEEHGRDTVFQRKDGSS